MPTARVEAYLRPQSIDEAFSTLDERTRLLAGGTDLILSFPPEVDTLLDLSDLHLDYVTEENGGFRIGAMTTLTDMMEHPGLAAHLDGVVPEMMRHVGSPLLRNVATIGGHLARGRLSDVIPLMLALDATLTFYDGAAHTVPMADFYADGVYRDRLVITETQIPAAAPQTAAAFLKFYRTFYDVALLNCACRVRLVDGVVTEARVVVGETPRLGASVPVAEEHLLGSGLHEEAITAAALLAAEHTPVGTDQRAGADYRRRLAEVAVRRCLTTIAGRLEAP